VPGAGGGQHAGDAIELAEPPGGQLIQLLLIEEGIVIEAHPHLFQAGGDHLAGGDVATLTPETPEKSLPHLGGQIGGFVLQRGLQQQRPAGIHPGRREVHAQVRCPEGNIIHFAEQGGEILGSVALTECMGQVGFVLNAHPPHLVGQPHAAQPLVQSETVWTVEIGNHHNPGTEKGGGQGNSRVRRLRKLDGK
jgi:hypothetical protein